MVFSLIKEAGLTNFGRSSLCGGGCLRAVNIAGRESCGEHFLYILLTFTLRPGGRFPLP